MMKLDQAMAYLCGDSPWRSLAALEKRLERSRSKLSKAEAAIAQERAARSRSAARDWAGYTGVLWAED